jgi:hypothetical protein
LRLVWGRPTSREALDPVVLAPWSEVPVESCALNNTARTSAAIVIRSPIPEVIFLLVDSRPTVLRLDEPSASFVPIPQAFSATRRLCGEQLVGLTHRRDAERAEFTQRTRLRSF